MKNYLFLILAAQSLGAMNDRFTDPREFMRQAQAGNLAFLEKALRAGADINQIDPETQFTALHTALWRCDRQTAAFLLTRGASVYKKARDGKTARHFLTQHLSPCYRNGMLICKDEPCVIAWPKEFLALIHDNCFMCLNQIEESGHVYDCGHAVHKACADISGECTICFRPHQDELSDPSEKDYVKKESKSEFASSEPLSATMPVLAAASAPVVEPASESTHITIEEARLAAEQARTARATRIYLQHEQDERIAAQRKTTQARATRAEAAQTETTKKDDEHVTTPSTLVPVATTTPTATPKPHGLAIMLGRLGY